MPANASVTKSNAELVSLVSFSKTATMFNPQKVRLGITPTGWSNSDDPSIDLVPPIPYQQILSEMALSGFKGSQMSGKYPQDMEVLKKELALRDFTISEPWVGTYFTTDGVTTQSKVRQGGLFTR
ncbi:MAG: hypothetical protein QNJ70_12095 [Xenococcaceae cyanobacterium MO_207.B15]|nr:hypothetical protein [Xenococcaceae cyanobacterium MO_207.B15]